ncbi:MAG: hypothetical protein K6F51_03600 [Acetatifactor sp.]|nr:hypothetical protein [Acetatifactor sp.]
MKDKSDIEYSELDQLFSEEFDDASDDEWLETLIDTEDAEEEPETKPSESEEKPKDEGSPASEKAGEGLSIQAPEESFFEMELTPSPKPAGKPMQIGAAKENVPKNQVKKRSPKSIARRQPMQKPSLPPKRSTLAWPQTQVQEIKPEKKINILNDVKRDKTKAKLYAKPKPDDRPKDHKPDTIQKTKKLDQGLCFQQQSHFQLFEQNIVRKVQAYPAQIKRESPFQGMMEFRNMPENSCVFHRFSNQSDDAFGLTVRDDNKKKKDPMGL